MKRGEERKEINGGFQKKISHLALDLLKTDVYQKTNKRERTRRKLNGGATAQPPWNWPRKSEHHTVTYITST
jgi:hypothetical protein